MDDDLWELGKKNEEEGSSHRMKSQQPFSQSSLLYASAGVIL